MTKTVIKKEKMQYSGVCLEIKFGSLNDRLYFDDENEFQGFVYALRLMVSMGAESISVECDEPEEQQETTEPVAATEGDAVCE